MNYSFKSRRPGLNRIVSQLPSISTGPKRVVIPHQSAKLMSSQEEKILSWSELQGKGRYLVSWPKHWKPSSPLPTTTGPAIVYRPSSLNTATDTVKSTSQLTWLNSLYQSFQHKVFDCVPLSCTQWTMLLTVDLFVVEKVSSVLFLLPAL